MSDGIDSFYRVEGTREFSRESPGTDRAIVLHGSRCLVDATLRNLLWVSPRGAPAQSDIAFLGTTADDRSLFVVALGDGVAHDVALAALGIRFESARFVDPMWELGRFESPEREALVTALALAQWSAQHRFCNTCGLALAWDEAARTKSCANPEGAHQHFPRLDPATIMLVHDRERVLLGRQSAWPPGLYSTLAGFVEPGESLEDAVAREVREEVGIRVDRVRYFGSEPWPFPRSLMFGFFARARTFDLRPSAEIDDARWFTRPELAALQERLVAQLPNFDVIARRLMSSWLCRGPR